MHGNPSRNGAAHLPLKLRLLSRVGRRYPLLSGLLRFSDHPRYRQWMNALEGEAHATLRNGLRLAVDPHDLNARMLCLFGTPDPKIILLLRNLLQPDDLLLDMGANYGAVGLLCHDVVEPEGRVHLFEPQPELCKRIRQSLDKADLPHVRLHPVALLDREGEVNLSRPTNHSGAASVTCSHGKDQHLPVAAVNLATYLPPLLNDRPWVGKLDVEGAEPMLLPWLLDHPRMRVLVVEAASLKKNEQLWRDLCDRSMSVFGVPRALMRLVLHKVRRPADLARYHDLVIARVPDAPQRITPRELRHRLTGNEGIIEDGRCTSRL